VITLKSRRQIEAIRAACRVVVEAQRLARTMLEPGVRTREIDAAVERLFERSHASPLFKGVPGTVPFPAVTCISVNEEVVHGIPGDRRLERGDIVTIDTGCRFDGWCGDAAWTYPVGEVDGVKRRLLEAGEQVLLLAIRELGLRRTWSEVARAIEREVKRFGFSLVEEFVGHGIGRELHEDPQVPSFVGPEMVEQDFDLQPGLVLAIEPMLAAGSSQVFVADDHWTVETGDGMPSVHFEHTVALTAAGPEILTAGVGAG
jgi:methionyl aminopeptidase